MDIKEIINAIDTITQFENRKEILIQDQSNLDLQTQDILHYIENNNFNAVTGYKLARKIKDIRKERRIVKNELEMINVFQANSNRLNNSTNRQFLLADLNKEYKRLTNGNYNYRILTEEEIKK